MNVFASTLGFVLSYLALMIPTYVLPYFGSNSTVMATMVGSMSGQGGGVFPTFWLHLMFLFALGVVAWTRGPAIGKSWLPVLPGLAAFFDLMPGFNWIPLLPTGLHVAAIITGAVRPDRLASETLRSRVALRQDKRFWTLAAGCAVFFSLFLIGIQRFSESTRRMATPPHSVSRTPLGAQPAARLAPEPAHSAAGAVALQPAPPAAANARVDAAVPIESAQPPSAPLENAVAASSDDRATLAQAPAPSALSAVGAPSARPQDAAAAPVVAASPQTQQRSSAAQEVAPEPVAAPIARSGAAPRIRTPRKRLPASPIEDAKIAAGRLMATDPCAAAQRLEPYLADERVQGMHQHAREACRR